MLEKYEQDYKEQWYYNLSFFLLPLVLICTFIFQPLYSLPVLTVAVRLPLLQSMHLITLYP